MVLLLSIMWISLMGSEKTSSWKSIFLPNGCTTLKSVDWLRLLPLFLSYKISFDFFICSQLIQFYFSSHCIFADNKFPQCWMNNVIPCILFNSGRVGRGCGGWWCPRFQKAGDTYPKAKMSDCLEKGSLSSSVSGASCWMSSGERWHSQPLGILSLSSLRLQKKKERKEKNSIDKKSGWLLGTIILPGPFRWPCWSSKVFRQSCEGICCLGIFILCVFCFLFLGNQVQVGRHSDSPLFTV